jgi:cytoskeletal protein RodZ
VREYHGEDIVGISEHLCIKPAYLFALEDSRYDTLPADAYVIGFLRTYALYLGLDGRAAVDQYRREMAGRRKKPQLTMPQPISEGRAPTIALLVGAAVAALLLYGLWYGLSSPDEEIVQQPVPLPQIQGEAVPVPAAPLPLAENAGQLSSTSSSGIPISVPAATTDDAIVIPSNAPADKSENPSATSDQPDAPQNVPDAPEVTTPAQGKPSAAPALQQEKSEAAKPQPATEQSKLPDADKAKDEAMEKMDAQEPEKNETVYGAKRKTRVSIRAEKQTWILVTDSRGLTIFDRTLQPGETYNVPEGQGLRLTTANSAGLHFVIEGKAYPKMDAGSQVVRALPLDPSLLRSRLSTGSMPGN